MSASTSALIIAIVGVIGTLAASIVSQVLLPVRVVKSLGCSACNDRTNMIERNGKGHWLTREVVI